MTKLAIFDLDGTLLDTVKDLGNATNHALTECGFPTHPIKAYYQMVGRGIYNLFRRRRPRWTVHGRSCPKDGLHIHSLLRCPQMRLHKTV